MKIEINKGKIIQIDKEDKPLIEKYGAIPFINIDMGTIPRSPNG